MQRKRRIISWMLILCMCFSVMSTNMASAYGNDVPTNIYEKYGIDEDFQGELIVQYEEIHKMNIFNKLFSGSDAITDTVTADEPILYEVAPNEDPKQVIRELEKNGTIEYMEPNRTLKLCDNETEVEQKDTYFDNQWALRDIGATDAWAKIGAASGSAIVAVLDTGVDYTHPDLQGTSGEPRIIQGENFVKDKKDGSKYSYNYGVMDDNGHGTFVAGIIAADCNNGIGIAGLAGDLNVQVLAVKVMNDDGEGNIFEISEGIRYAADRGADVINLSLGGEGYSQTMANAVKYAQDKGTLVVAAAGNDGKDGSNFYPAAYSDVLTVGALGQDEAIASFSNYGEELDLMAPGVQIYSTSIKKEALFGDQISGYYAQFNGTSFAAPYAAGVAALYKVIHSDASAEMTKEALLQTAVDLEDSGWDEKSGYGKLNMADAVDPQTSLDAVIKLDGVKRNDYFKGTVTLNANILNEEKGIDSVRFYLDTTADSGLLGEALAQEAGKYSLEWNTLNYEDGSHEIIAAAFKDGVLLEKDSLPIQIINTTKNGILLNIKDPSGNAGVGAFVNVYVKDEEHKDYDRIYTGKSNKLGIARIPGTLGKDLSDVRVVVTGSFDYAEMKYGNALYLYQQELRGPGEFTITGDNAQPVLFQTQDKTGSEMVDVAYYATAVDKDGLNIGTTNELNPNKETAPVVFADPGQYDFFSYSKKNENTYFLTQWAQKITKGTSPQTLLFDGTKTGQVHLATDDETRVTSGVVYLYNDKTNASLGMKLGGENVYVSADQYRYRVDAQVQDPDGGENWIYTFDSGKPGIQINEGLITEIKTGGTIKINNFDISYEAVEDHVAEANKIYNADTIKTVTEDGKTIIKFPIGYELFQTLNRFCDDYGNFLCGISRGSLSSTSITSMDASVSGQDDEEEDDQKVINPRFRVLDADGEWVYPIYWDLMGGHEDGQSSVNFFEFTFWDVMDLDGKTGDYELQLSLEKNPLNDRLSKILNVRLYDDNLHKILTYDKDGITKDVNFTTTLTVPYVYIYSLKQNTDVDAVSTATTSKDNPMGGGKVDMISSATPNTQTSYWEQTYGAWGNKYQNEQDFGTVALDSSIKLSKEKNGNLAIFRYTLKDGETYIYLFRPFTELQDLDTNIDLKSLGLKKVTIPSLEADGISSDYVSSNNNIIFPVKSGDEIISLRMPVFTEDVWVEPGQYSFDGQYITQPDKNGKQTNYYVVDRDVNVDQDLTVDFDLSKNIRIIPDAVTVGYRKLKGTALLPFSDYGQNFNIQESQGSIFSIPADIDYKNISIVLGLADNEKPSYVWNYLLKLPQDISLKAGEDYHLKVGGTFKTKIELTKHSFASEEKLKGYSGVTDSFGNQLLSTRITADTEWLDIVSGTGASSIYSLSGSHISIASPEQSQDYSIQHEETDNANIVYPHMRLYGIENGQETLLYNETKSAYYHAFEELLTGLAEGSYRAEIAFSGSPNGPVTTGQTEGLFSIGTEQNNDAGDSPSGKDNTPGEDNTDQPVTAAVSVTAKAGKNGLANAVIPSKTISAAITKAKADAKAQGKSEKDVTVSVTLKNPAKTKSLGIVLNQSLLKQLNDANVSQFEINGQLLSLNLNQEAIQQLQAQSSNDVKLTVKPVTVKGIRNAYKITMTTVKKGKTVSITKLNGGSATLSIPYKPGKSENPDYLYAVSVNSKNKVTRISNSVYDASSKSVRFTTKHFSVYGVGYKAPASAVKAAK